MILEPEQRKKFERFIEKLDGNLKEFWSKYGKTMMAKGRHTDFFIEPAMLIGDEVNPEVVKRVALVYLTKMTPQQVLSDQAIVLEDKIIINSESGKKAMEVLEEQLINGMTNKVVDAIGKALARRNYIPEEEEGKYCFGEIKEALAEFLADYEKGDSKNMLKDAILLLKNGAPQERLTQPAFVKTTAGKPDSVHPTQPTAGRPALASSTPSDVIPNPLAKRKKRAMPR